MGPWAFIIILVFGCAASAPELAADEIDARDVRLPPGAKPGMFITWRIEESEPDETTVVEETIACVAPNTVEWRETFQDGVWRGPSGGTGSPLRAFVEEFDPDEARKEADRRGKAAGISTDDVKVDQEHVREELSTPAGTFECLRWTMKGRLLLMKMRTDTWHAAERTLPLSTLVKLQMTGPAGYSLAQPLTAFGTSGAKPTLRIP